MGAELNRRVNILGTEYLILTKDYEDDEVFEREGLEGYCSTTKPEIIVGLLSTFPCFKDETKDDLIQLEKRILRHEIVHAFLFESGLDENSNHAESWATNEEMVDWLAIQVPKIYKAWQEVGAL